jgi:predicted branched-subunit amino acid permease
MRQCSKNMNLYLDNPPSICYNIAQQFFFEAIMKTSKLYLRGMRDGIPIALGYLSVSFGFGVSAVSGGLSPLEAVLMSLTNVTSAGQMAGLASITADGAIVLLTLATMLEVALTQLVINIRYFLMSLSLTQKLDGGFTLPHRLLTSFGITDEIFGVASSQKGDISPRYLYGLIFLPVLGWTLGTLLGSVAGTILPDSLKHALGITIYGMFVAIVVPPAKADRGVLIASLLAIAVSCVIAFVPLFGFITSGFAIIIAALIGAVVAAILRPIDVADEGAEGGAQ